jgi:hypothetical protein
MLDNLSRATVSAESPAFTAPAEGPIMNSGDGPPLIAWSSPLAAKPHLPPVTGDVYFVEIAVPGRRCPVNLITTNLSWQLDATTWAELTAGGAKTLSVTLTSAYLETGLITDGPFRPDAPRTFKVQ